MREVVQPTVPKEDRGAIDTFNSITSFSEATPSGGRIDSNSGVTAIQGQSYHLRTNNASCHFSFSAEL